MTTVGSLRGALHSGANGADVAKQVRALEIHLACRRQIGETRPIRISVTCQGKPPERIIFAAVSNIVFINSTLILKGIGMDGQDITGTFSHPIAIAHDNIF